jgi:hypothetical protein
MESALVPLTVLHFMAFTSMAIFLGAAIKLLIHFVLNLGRNRHRVQIKGCLSAEHISAQNCDEKSGKSQKFPSITLAVFVFGFGFWIWTGSLMSLHSEEIARASFSTVVSQLNELNNYGNGKETLPSPGTK